jgi:hypothetical protein
MAFPRYSLAYDRLSGAGLSSPFLDVAHVVIGELAAIAGKALIVSQRAGFASARPHFMLYLMLYFADVRLAGRFLSRGPDLKFCRQETSASLRPF